MDHWNDLRGGMEGKDSRSVVGGVRLSWSYDFIDVPVEGMEGVGYPMDWISRIRWTMHTMTWIQPTYSEWMCWKQRAMGSGSDQVYFLHLGGDLSSQVHRS
ncbi:receptor expression-enhancing protein 4 [Moniliophthora roreri]|nr:receptor expression-enhancing protein 4 [Moniliophthora roreri]